MNELQIFTNSEFGSVRTTSINDEPWFVGKDVCEAFGDTNYRRSLSRIEEEDKHIAKIDTPGGKQNMTFVNESGLYSLLFLMQPTKARGVSQSEHPYEERVQKLKHFKHWVTSEVLPSIRKHGAYATPITIDNIIANPDFGIKLFQNLKEEQEKRRKLESTVAEMKPKVTYYDVAMRSKDLTPISVIAKDYGMSGAQMNKWLHQKGIQYRVGNTWAVYQKYADKGYTHTRVSNYVGKDCRTHSSFHTCWTQKGRLFIYELMKEDGNLPLIEQGKG